MEEVTSFSRGHMKTVTGENVPDIPAVNALTKKIDLPADVSNKNDQSTLDKSEFQINQNKKVFLRLDIIDQKTPN
jgi:hypothetical protein